MAKRYDHAAFLALADGQRTVQEVAAALGIPLARAYARATSLREQGLPAAFLKAGSKAPVDREAFVAAVTGSTAREAAAKLGIGFSTVYARATRLRRQGVRVPAFQRAPRIPAPVEACPACSRAMPRNKRRPQPSPGDPS